MLTNEIVSSVPPGSEFEKYRSLLSCPGCNNVSSLNKDGKEPSVRYRCKLKECRKTMGPLFIQRQIDQISNKNVSNWADEVDDPPLIQSSVDHSLSSSQFISNDNINDDVVITRSSVSRHDTMSNPDTRPLSKPFTFDSSDMSALQTPRFCIPNLQTVKILMLD